MTKVISALGLKGGTLKSFISNNTAGIKSLDGFKVLLVGADAQDDVSPNFDIDRNEHPKGLYDYLILDTPFNDCVYRHSDNLDVLMSDTRMEDFDVEFTIKEMQKLSLKQLKTANKNSLNLKYLNDKLALDANGYDYIVFDTAPAFNLITRQILNIDFAEESGLLLTYEPEVYGLKNILRLINKIQFLKADNKKLTIKGIIPVKVENNKTHRTILKMLKETIAPLNIKVAENVIKKSIKPTEFLWEYDEIFSNYSKDDLQKVYQPHLEIYNKILEELEV